MASVKKRNNDALKFVGARAVKKACQCERWSNIFIWQREPNPFIKGQLDIWPWASVIMLMPTPKMLTPMKSRSVTSAKVDFADISKFYSKYMEKATILKPVIMKLCNIPAPCILT